MAEKRNLEAALHKAVDRRTRRSALQATLFLGLAVAAAVGSAVLLTRYMEARTAAARVPTGPVMVAAADLPVGTELRAEHVQLVAWPVATRPEQAFSEPAPLVGQVVSTRLVKGEIFLPGKLVGGGGGLSALLPPGMRAAAVRVDDVVGVAGFIHPGDTVDVIATIRQDGNGATSSRVILQRITVLAVGKEIDQRSRPNEKVVQATVATLQVDAEESERLALAAAQGKILLTLRNKGDQETVATRGVTPATLLALALEPKPVDPAPKASARPARPRPVRHEVVRDAVEVRPQGEVVEILRGDLFERRDFQNRGGK